MLRLISVTLLTLLMSFSVQAAESGYPLEHMEPDLHDQASLQRGAKTYLNYCMACHSLKYQRYKRTAADIGIPEDLMLEHLIFDPETKIGDLMTNNMKIATAKNWFGAAPPDLTMYSNLKGGPDYLYTYLKSFYQDETRPFGVNNLVFENVGMPHVLMELQGMQVKTCKDVPRLAANGGEMRDPLTNDYITEKLCGDELVHRGFSPLTHVEGTGSLSAEEYDQVVYDLSNFLYYTGEPARLQRTTIGGYVLLFLAFFYVFAWLLGREYHKEFHREH
ncbi:MAG: cytochrome c1 [Pseudomonadales bacterium]|nr:cytochrome c1 [Pseudomonadales bacterium]